MTLWSQQGCSELVKLLHGCDKVVTRLSQGCYKLETRLQGLYNLVITLSFLYGYLRSESNKSAIISLLVELYAVTISVDNLNLPLINSL